MGFEAIFIDSAKHIGFYDRDNYTGAGALPEYDQVQYVLNEIRRRSGSFTVAFIGEKSTDDFKNASDKLPSFMQMEDIFPLRYDTSTHHLMMCNPSYSISGSPECHWENLFAKEDGRIFNHQVGEIFAHALAL